MAFLSLKLMAGHVEKFILSFKNIKFRLKLTPRLHMSFIVREVFNYFNFISLNFKLFFPHGRRMRKIREGEKIRSTPIREGVGISKRKFNCRRK
jgi:hypothetical protein